MGNTKTKTHAISELTISNFIEDNANTFQIYCIMIP